MNAIIYRFLLIIITINTIIVLLPNAIVSVCTNEVGLSVCVYICSRSVSVRTYEVGVSVCAYIS